jgi:hypothetical protein
MADPSRVAALLGRVGELLSFADILQERFDLSCRNEVEFLPPMQPPFPVTGAPIFDWIIFVFGVVLCLYSLRVSSDRARPIVRNLALAVLGFLACQLVLVMMKVPSAKAVVLSVFVALMAFSPREQQNASFTVRSKSGANEMPEAAKARRVPNM